MPKNLIKTIIRELPRFAEQEGYFYSVNRNSLINSICEYNDVERGIAENIVMMCECLLATLSVLNVNYLLKGEWCFVSFPAQLMATSVLMALIDDDSRFFKPNFWNTQGSCNATKDRQRDVLRYVEIARFENHFSHQAQPIRYCYVAWGIIKLDDKILFYQREDTKKRFEDSAGDYGLIGGRANQNDVPMTDKTALIKELQSPHSELIKNALPKTLQRELKEEAGLINQSHYTFKPWRKLKPYRQVEGTAPNHALTEYYLEIFQIELTLDGYLSLQRKVKDDERLVWFSIDDIVRGRTNDGKIAYIKALYDDFANDQNELSKKLSELPDSFVTSYPYQSSKYGVTFPINNDRSILAGLLGKEKKLDLQLTDRQLAILLGLAAHLRRFEFASIHENIIFHPYGWIEFPKESVIQSELINLSGLLNETDLIIESHHDSLFRLSISPEYVYFNESIFSFTVKESDLTGVYSKIPVIIHRQTFNTALGQVEEKIEGFTITLEFANDLYKLYTNKYSTDNEEAIKIEDNYKKGLSKKPEFIALGLRRLIRQEASIFKFVVDFKLI